MINMKIRSRLAICLFGGCFCLFPALGAEAGKMQLELQRRVQAPDGTWQVTNTVEKIDPAKTAIVIVDMWDKHWCKTLTARVAAMVRPMNETLDAARFLGMTVVHAPSDVVNFYKDYPQRRAMQAIPNAPVEQKVKLSPSSAPYGGGGCCCGPNRPCPGGRPWRREIESLFIADSDLIADCNNGQELAGLCKERGITNLLYMGVHLNMCVLKRGCGILAMARNGVRCMLVRDLTDAATGNGYDPDTRKPDPAFTPDIGTARTVEYIEKYVIPTIDRNQIVAAERKKRGVDPRYRHASREAYEKWHDLKYGLRIHWGLYSILGVEASWPVKKMTNPKKQEYWDLYKRFNPTEFDAEKWMQEFKQFGFKCFAFTTKHHDGFSMFDTKTRVTRHVNWTAAGGPKIEDCDKAFSIMETPFKRDIVKELMDAAHKHGMAVDLYFSHPDWFDADFRFDEWNPYQDKNYNNKTDSEGYARFIKRHRGQILELLSNYGNVDMMCLDMSLPGFCWNDILESVIMARQLQPDVLFRERGIDAYGDYTTPENWIPDEADKRVDRPWMVIHTLSGQFAYDSVGTRYKSGEWVLSKLIDIVAKGGNFMPSIGPDEKGNFHPAAIKQLEYVGDWLKVNGEAIYATRPSKYYKEGNDVRFTRSKDYKYIYAMVMKWPGETFKLKTVRPRDGSNITMLGVKDPLKWRMDNTEGLVIDIPKTLVADENRPCKQAWAFRIEGSPL